MKKFLLLTAALFLPMGVMADCLLKLNTADSSFAIGPFVDENDGITPETALTITASDVLLKKKGSTTFALKTEATACTHRSNGWYTCPLDATDTNTEGNLIVAVTESGAVPTWRECVVLRETAPIVVSTTIATLATQVSFTLTAGSADDNAYNGCSAIVTDISTPAQKAYAQVRDYTGSTKTVTLAYDPGIFTMAATDLVDISCGPVMR